MPTPSPRRPTRASLSLAGGCLLVLTLLVSSGIATHASEAGAKGSPAQNPGVPQPSFPSPSRFPSPSETNPAPLTPKQQRAILKANYAKMKQDADELAALAKSLQQDLDKSNENVLSLDVVEKADKIEKLAKKIKGTALE
jgi:hypothetical protein